MKCEDTTHNQKKCTMCKSEERENWALVLRAESVRTEEGLSSVLVSSAISSMAG